MGVLKTKDSSSTNKKETSSFYGDCNESFVHSCLCFYPSDMSVTSKSPSNKAHVRTLRNILKYLSIFEHILKIIFFKESSKNMSAKFAQ